MNAPRPPLSWQALAGVLGGAVAVPAYALLCHVAASAPQPGLLEAAVFIVPMMAFAGLVAWRSAHRAAWMALWLAAWAALFLLRAQLGAGTAWVLLLQHVGINAMLALGFGRTLVPGALPLVSRMAAFVHGAPLSPGLLRYTRGATWAWTLYFMAAASMSLLLFALAPVAVWSAYVNLLSFPLLGAMFVAEYLARVLLVPRAERSGFFDAFTAYRRYTRQREAGEP